MRMKGHTENFQTPSAVDSDTDIVESDDETRKTFHQFDILFSRTGLLEENKEIKVAIKGIRSSYEELYKDKIALVQLLARWKNEEDIRLKFKTRELQNELEQLRNSSETVLANTQIQLQEKSEKYRSVKLKLLEVEKYIDITKEENKSLKKQISKQQRQISTLEEIQQQVEHSVDKEQEALITKLQNHEITQAETIRNLEEEIEDLKTRRVNEEKIQELFVSQNVTEVNQAYRNLQKLFDKLTEDYKKMEMLQNDMRRENQLIKQHNNVLQSQLSESREDLTQLKFKHGQELREIHNQFERKLVASQEGFLKDLTHFRDSIAELTRTHEEEMESFKLESHDKAQKFQEEFTIARKNFEEQINILKESHEKVVRETTADEEMLKTSSATFHSDSRFERKAAEFMAEMQLRFNNIRTELKTPHLSQMFSYRSSSVF